MTKIDPPAAETKADPLAAAFAHELTYRSALAQWVASTADNQPLPRDVYRAQLNSAAAFGDASATPEFPLLALKAAPKALDLVKRFEELFESAAIDEPPANLWFAAAEAYSAALAECRAEVLGKRRYFESVQQLAKEKVGPDQIFRMTGCDIFEIRKEIEVPGSGTFPPVAAYPANKAEEAAETQTALESLEAATSLRMHVRLLRDRGLCD